MKVLCNEIILVNNLRIADTFSSRLVGLLGRKKIQDEGLLLMKCSSIHCFFMKFTIDALYLSNDMVVLYKETLKPGRIGSFVKKTSHVLELPEGAADCVKSGDVLAFID